MSDESITDLNACWHPGAVRNAVINSAQKLTKYALPAPPLSFLKKLADQAESMTNEAIAEAIASRNVDTIVSNIKEANRLFYELGDEIFLATEEANDPVIAQFAASLLLNGIDGYNHATYVDAWGAHPDPEWGTIWGIHKSIRDFTPAFIFKVCMCGDVRFLAVECHAPNRRLPDDLQDRLRARTMIVSGVPTVSFSPTEINTDTDACVLEVNDALHTLAEELLALHGVSQPPRREFRPRVGV